MNFDQYRLISDLFNLLIRKGKICFTNSQFNIQSVWTSWTWQIGYNPFDRIDVNELYSLLCNGLRVIGATEIINIEPLFIQLEVNSKNFWGCGIFDKRNIVRFSWNRILSRHVASENCINIYKCIWNLNNLYYSTFIISRAKLYYIV